MALIHMSPYLIFQIYGIAFALLVLGGAIYVKILFTAKRALERIYEIDKNFYGEIVSNSGESWVSRGYISFRDISLWWKLYVMLYKDQRMSRYIGSNEQVRYRFLIKLIISCLVISILLVATSFMLAFYMMSES